MLRLRVHVRDLDSLDRAARRADRERLAGLVGVHVHLHRRGIADDEQRVAELLELALELLALQAFALDHERRAVAELRELLVDRVEPERLAGRRFRDRLAGRGRREPAHDLDETRAARVHDARVAQDVEHVLRAREGLLTGVHELDEELRGGLASGRRAPLPQRARGSPSASSPRPGGEPRGTPRRSLLGTLGRARRRPRAPRRPRTSAKPRTIWERITPELPRAPISAARVTSLASVGAVGRLRRLERVDDRACGQGQVRAGVAVGHRVHVEVVDPLAVRFERGERAARELERRHPVFTSWMCTSTDATLRPVSRSRSYATRLRRPDATSARLSPYSTTT